MKIDVKVPSPGESISQVQLANWLVEPGQQVEKDQEIAEIDSDKATLSLSAEESGKIELLIEEGETIDVGSVVATIQTDVQGLKKDAGSSESKSKQIQPKEEIAKPGKASEEKPLAGNNEVSAFHISPLANKLMKEKNISEKEIFDFFKNLRLSKSDVEFYLTEKDKQVKTIDAPKSSWGGTREIEHKKMSMLRLKLGERLVSVKNETAMLTTFNEVNMTPIMSIRKKYKEVFKEKYGIGLGFMSFFTRAVTEALNLFPNVNAQILDKEIVLHKYADIGIAVSAPKGLMVPVIRNAETMGFAEIELKIKELAIKARDGKLSLDEMMGGTFTITNGGVFGSMLSTPIINPPQSAILGMHNIVERPIAVNGKVEIHPIMYVALSYDHRVIDGKESVGFLFKVKEMLEDPVRLMFAGSDPEKEMLGL
jgi:2-oxoglutarate dehydrogenase E2 component (dihydrolipoamide succinyltransferase)